MTDDTIHTCSYECERPGCIRAQRDYLAARLPAIEADRQRRGEPVAWPLASPEDAAKGWTLDYRFLEQVERIASQRTNYTTSMEATEEVLIAANEVLRASQPASAAYAGCTIWRGSLRVSVTETEAIERLCCADEAFCALVQRALDSLAAAWDADALKQEKGQ